MKRARPTSVLIHLHLTHTLMRNISKLSCTLSTVAVLGLAAACSDAPTAARAPRPTAPSLAAGVTTQVGDTTITVFTVDPTSTEMYVEAGIFKLKLAANSICDPAVSTYGPGEWDQPCTTLTRTISVTARSYTTQAGEPVVKFSPDLRFAPGKVNTLWLWKSGLSSTSPIPNIKWCPTGATACVDEAAADPSVATTRATNGFLTRRIKHFSGYTTTWGFDGGGDEGDGDGDNDNPMGGTGGTGY